MSGIGTSQPRVDGPLKAGGAATYAADVKIPNLAFGVLLCSTIVKGRIAAIDTSLASAQPGVLDIITHQNCPPFQKPPKPIPSQGQSLLPLQGADISYYGEHVGVVVAESFEAACAAADLVEIDYSPANVPSQFAMAKSAKAAGGARDTTWGDFAGALAKAPVKVDQQYTTPYVHHNSIEPPATTASWDGDTLTLHDSTQWLAGVRTLVAALLGIPPANIRVMSPFVGGSFGAKRVTWPHVYLAAVAARLARRPVRLVVTRAQMYTTLGYRPQTVQKITLGARRDGTLQAFRHNAATTTSEFDNFIEPASAKTGMMYACPNGTFSRTLAKVALGTPTTMRAPGESPGFFALECAMDELAYAVTVDPLKLRLLNYADVDPTTKSPWSSKSLKECYAKGAAQFGWSKRKASPGSMRDGPLLIGMGMASAAYPANRSPASASVTLFADGHAVVQSATHEMGGGTYTAMAVIAADALGLDIGQVQVQLGDSSLAATTVSGGSRTVNSVGPAVEAAAIQVIDRLVALAIADPGSPLYQAEASQVFAAGGSLRLKSKPSSADPIEKILLRHNLSSVQMTASTAPNTAASKYSQYAFGAHFAEVRVDPEFGEVRVSRYVGAFAAGQIINPLTARSQLVGGIVGGIGMALLEESVVDPNIGTFINRNLADYRLPVHADVPAIEVILVPEQDSVTSPLGTKGVGELGIVGAAAAIANAVFHATGKRIRDLPITPEKLLSLDASHARAIQRRQYVRK
jgi:xanthine dehydrogenase YagR molybdenum-binding subunit